MPTKKERKSMGRVIDSIRRKNIPLAAEPWNQPEQLLREAADDIRRLRRRVEVAEAKIEVMNLFRSLLVRNENGCCALTEGIESRIEQHLAPTPAHSFRPHKSKHL